MSHAEKLREAIRLHATATTPIDRLATYLWLCAIVASMRRAAVAS